MMTLRLPTLLRGNFAPATRVALGLVSLMVTLLLMADTFVPGFMADQQRQALQQRGLVAQLLSTEAAQVLQDSDPGELQRVLVRGLQREPALRSVALVIGDRQQAFAGDAAARWTLAPDDASTVDQIRSRLLHAGQPWGELRLVFQPVLPDSLWGWLRHPAVLGTLFVALVGLLAFQLYVRRAMRYLDPQSAVPERVRTAFDTLTEGVLVLDSQSRIMLVNQESRRLHGELRNQWIGEPVEKLETLVAAARVAHPTELPWLRVLRTHEPLRGTRLRLRNAEGEAREVVMNCSPVQDGERRARGCLLTFSDVTELHERTERLRVALEELSTSQAELEVRNAELLRLATRDPMTGCLNRRAFMQEADKLFAQARAQGTPLACIMCDIDHFKSVNDRFGHAAGDLVIQGAAKALETTTRLGSIVGRYGGEEFCVMIAGASLERMMEIAERVRAEVQATVGGALRDHPGIVITMSFGVAPLEADTASPAVLIDFADQALYHSKQNGRNRVTDWPTVQALRVAKPGA